VQFKRVERVGEAMKEEISSIIQKELKDPRLGFLTVTGVSLSRDLRHAKVYVSVLGEEEVMEKTLESLKGGVGYIRRLLGSRMKLKFIPELSFRLDRSPAQSAHIEKILKGLEKEKDLESE